MEAAETHHQIHLLNSANVWATTKEEIRALCRCPFTSAVTIRTSLPSGFTHDEAVHQYRFLDTATMNPLSESNLTKPHGQNVENVSSINTLGYSPIALPEYVDMIKSLEDARRQTEQQQPKEIIFSVTGSVSEVGLSHRALQESGIPNIAMEVNLSCPNIPGKPPPAYSMDGLLPYLEKLRDRRAAGGRNDIAVGLKVPPYTYQGQFDDIIQALLTIEATHPSSQPIDFITATNTLGSCLTLPPYDAGETDGLGPGGLGGAAIHSLALGNVYKLRKMLDHHASLSRIQIIGVGGVSSGAGYRRMIAAGAQKVAIGTALGANGVGIFEKIHREAQSFSVTGPEGADRIRWFKTVLGPDGRERYQMLGDRQLSDEAYAVRQIAPLKRRGTTTIVEPTTVQPQRHNSPPSSERTETRRVPAGHSNHDDEIPQGISLPTVTKCPLSFTDVQHRKRTKKRKDRDEDLDAAEKKRKKKRRVEPIADEHD